MERRHDTRRQVAISATVTDPDGQRRHTCAIRDASEGGCKLVSTSVDELPDRIRIVVDGVAQPIFAEIMWRDRRMAGVRFEWPNQELASEKSADWLDLDIEDAVD